jgi:hypothetical protein
MTPGVEAPQHTPHRKLPNMNGCTLMRAQGAKLDDLQTQISRVAGAVTGLADSASSGDFAPLSELQTLQTSVAGISPLGSLLAKSNGLDCRELRAGDAAQMNNILPGGRSFTMCQPAAAWTATTTAFGEFLPAGATWVTVTGAAVKPVCTPMPARSGLFGPAVMCSGSVSEAMAHAVDMRTIRDRCLVEVAANVSSCKYQDTLAENVFCSTVTTQGKCDVTTMYNGLMCSWHPDATGKNVCMSSRQAGKEMWKAQCTAA